ncbi:hypothetical protein GOODEAATRI_004785 [Goodea atripinnis]|uniref:Uncharacterized protein n=1 Tax=Goodea atripinnis TaxID=208336 RepID=A0ABV0MYS7_9TELE
MSVNSPSHHHSGSLPEPMNDTNYVPMTPSTMEFSSLGKQVPPPAHMGFRSSPKTPPRRPLLNEFQPPPVDRNLKPDRKGKPAPLEIKPLPEWEEPCTPVRSPVTRSFARDFFFGINSFSLALIPFAVFLLFHHSTYFLSPPVPHFLGFLRLWLQPFSLSYIFSLTICISFVFLCSLLLPPLLTFCREESFYCTVPITPVKREVEELDTIEEIMKMAAPMPVDGGSSPMVKPKGDKQVEYLDLDLESGKSTPPRKIKNNTTGISASDERVDYVVVDQQRTQALKSTREAWSEDRQLTETDAPSKVTK